MYTIFTRARETCMSRQKAVVGVSPSPRYYVSQPTFCFSFRFFHKIREFPTAFVTTITLTP